MAADKLREPYDLILLSCKAYDLPSAIDAFAPAVGPNTAILPLLNGMATWTLWPRVSAPAPSSAASA